MAKFLLSRFTGWVHLGISRCNRSPAVCMCGTAGGPLVGCDVYRNNLESALKHKFLPESSFWPSGCGVDLRILTVARSQVMLVQNRNYSENHSCCDYFPHLFASHTSFCANTFFFFWGHSLPSQGQELVLFTLDPVSRIELGTEHVFGCGWHLPPIQPLLQRWPKQDMGLHVSHRLWMRLSIWSNFMQ